MISFSSELFRRAVAYVGGNPAAAVLEERDRLRSPERPMEQDPKLAQLVGFIAVVIRTVPPEAAHVIPPNANAEPRFAKDRVESGNVESSFGSSINIIYIFQLCTDGTELATSFREQRGARRP
jgi:hypothetical protein